MAMASVHNTTIKLPLFQTNSLFSGQPSSRLIPPPSPLSRSVLTLVRRRSNASRPISSPSKKTARRGKVDVGKDGDVDEDAFEALFKQLEEDLKNDEEAVNDGDDDISEEDLATLERELEEALAEDEDLSDLLNLMAGGETDDDGEQQDETNDYVEGEGEKEEEELVKLKGWQLRRLAEALKVGRRKTSIKNLSTELCIDRAIVLELLRDPPPKLLMLSAALPDKPAPTTVTTPDTTEATPSVGPTEVTNDSQPEAKEETPVHVLQGNWSAQKRIKKAHINTLETVYRRSKRPTNAMISSIIQVTNLPKKKVVKWFEDKRAADGLPQERLPFQPSSSPAFSKLIDL